MTFSCKNMEGCPMYNYMSSSLRILQLQPFLNDFCLNPERYRECVRYKIIEEGKEPPARLLPDGKLLKA